MLCPGSVPAMGAQDLTKRASCSIINLSIPFYEILKSFCKRVSKLTTGFFLISLELLYRPFSTHLPYSHSTRCDLFKIYLIRGTRWRTFWSLAYPFYIFWFITPPNLDGHIGSSILARVLLWFSCEYVANEFSYSWATWYKPSYIKIFARTIYNQYPFSNNILSFIYYVCN